MQGLIRIKESMQLPFLQLQSVRSGKAGQMNIQHLILGRYRGEEQPILFLMK